jgi:four helix bundle protein
MSKNGYSEAYDLEDRTFQFARGIRAFVKNLPKTISNVEDIKQLIMASGSVGGNYIEANDPLSKKDFTMRIKISRKEAKGGRYWLRLIDTANQVEQENERQELISEANHLMNIFGAILQKSK